jgi:hypothetical protein
LSFIRPILEYGNVIWDNCTQNEANLLESVQVEADRIITGLRVNSSRSKLYSELGWNPFIKEERNTLQDLICSCNGTSPCTKACVCFEENLACTDLCFSAKVRMVQTCTNAYIERRNVLFFEMCLCICRTQPGENKFASNYIDIRVASICSKKRLLFSYLTCVFFQCMRLCMFAPF